jgi:D-alanyl-D-alanine carboxypeptidase
MKRLFLSVIFLFLANLFLKAQNQPVKNSDSLHAIMKKYTDAGLPGVALAIYSEKYGWWAGAEGYAKLEKKLHMTNAHLHYLQSISKTYMAAAILKLYEQGKILLDSPIMKYLPGKYRHYLKHANQVTVRMLLNHTSGIAEYSDDPAFVTFILEHPLRSFDVSDVLKIIELKDLIFIPGSRHSYSNTNYELLAVIADSLTGDHAAFISNYILKPLELTHTYYRNDPGYLHYTQLVDSYWDVLNTGRPANVTAIQKTNVSSFIGDDGMVCTSTDAVKFLKGLVEGKLLSPSTMAEMETWVDDREGNPIYGLGLVHYAAAGLTGFGHSGGGIGGGCILMYVPEKKVYIFMATNLGTLFEGELTSKANQLKDEILATVLQ